LDSISIPHVFIKATTKFEQGSKMLPLL
jgi:hypothetical protein